MDKEIFFTLEDGQEYKNTVYYLPFGFYIQYSKKYTSLISCDRCYTQDCYSRI